MYTVVVTRRQIACLQCMLRMVFVYRTSQAVEYASPEDKDGLVAKVIDYADTYHELDLQLRFAAERCSIDDRSVLSLTENQFGLIKRLVELKYATPTELSEGIVQVQPSLVAAIGAAVRVDDGVQSGAFGGMLN